MLKVDSPFKNIPIVIDKKQAIFLDGMRHSIEILSFAYERLRNSLGNIANDKTVIEDNGGFTSVFLDAWAFVDAVDRFGSLWRMQPAKESLPIEFSVKNITEKLQPIRDVRNVADHISQKIDQIASLNASVLGEIKWISILDDNPLKVKACVIRPGVTIKDLSVNFDFPEENLVSYYKTTRIIISAGKHKANLTESYEIVSSVVKYAEKSLMIAYKRIGSTESYPSDFFTEAELEINKTI